MADWFFHLFKPGDPAITVLALSVVAATGIALGTIRIFGINGGIAGVLFTGLFFGHFLHQMQPPAAAGGAHTEILSEHVLHFAREFGLILFVYTIGVQVGPGFFASLRRQGLPLNIMAGSIVLLGVAVTVGIHYIGGVDVPAAVGLFSGATTNTPSMGASLQAMKDLKLPPEAINTTPMAYAMAYPFGIIGIILTMILMRFLFKVNLQTESEQLMAVLDKGRSKLDTINLEVKNPNLDGLPLRKVPTLSESGVVISRVMHEGKQDVATGDTVLRTGDILLAVGPKERLEALKLIVGSESKVDLKRMPSHITTRRIIVTKNAALGETIEDLDLGKRFDVTVTRLHRAEIELPPAGVKLQFGDNLLCVGEEGDIKKVAAELGDSAKQLNHPQVIPIFVGIALGVILGSIPVALPGMPAPVKLGLAGGPLVVAIILSRLGHFGPLVWYMPLSANFMLREVGIVLFLATVGLLSGGRFAETLIHGDGLYWMAVASLITVVPLLIVALVARAIYKVNYLSLCGLLAGSMTDPPALAFAGTVTGSDAPSVAYATVYPLTMLLRVLTAQAMVLMLMR